jgi:D-alanyl-D-alanine carboxypeptidase
LGIDFPGAFDDRGFASSQVVIEGTVIVQLACQGDSFVLGIDAATGQTKWRKDLPRITAWASPTPFAFEGKNYVLIQSAKDFQVIDPEQGDSRWRYEAQGSLIPSPTSAKNSIFISSAGLTRLDVDLKSPTPTKVWSEQRLGSSGVSPVLFRDRVFLIRGNNVLTCGHVSDGDIVWQMRMKGSRMWATPLLIGDLLYVVNDAGLTQVVDVSGKQGRLVAENDLAEEILGSPAFANDAIFFRGAKHVFKVMETSQKDAAGSPADDAQDQERERSALKQNLQAALDAMVEKEKFPGATLAIAMPNQAVLELSSGWQDQEQKIAMPQGARMLVGSVGKTFVSAVVLQLVAEGKLELDALASKYLSEQSGDGWFAKIPNSDTITLRSLLNHTSGLPRYIFTPGFLEAVKQEPYRKWSPVEQLKFIHDLEPVHPVGQGWAYSDTNYLILGLIVEKVSGNHFYDEAQRRLLEPLKLSQTEPSSHPELPELIPGYVGDNNFFSLPKKTVVDGKYVMDPGFEWCGGGFLSNSGDLARWAKQVYAGKVLDEQRRQELFSAVDFRSGQASDSGYGLGCFVWNTKQGMFVGHAGIMPGYLTQVEYSQKHHFSIALQINTDQGLGQSLHGHCQDFAAIVIADVVKKNEERDSN